MFGQQRFLPLSQLAILLMLTGVFFIIGAFFTVYVAALTMHVPFDTLLKNPTAITNNPAAARISQAVGTFFMFAAPVLIFGYVINRRRPVQYIGFNRVISGKQVFYTVLIFMAALMVGAALNLVNSIIPLTQHAETYVKNLENEYMKETSAMLDLKDTKGYLLSMLMLVLLPSIFEEVFFRGCLQKVVVGLTRNAFWGILITSILFSAVHLSYYGFISRIFLGLTLGYLYYYSKNIWPCILLHFLNNGFIITMAYVAVGRGKTMTDALTDNDITGKMAIYNTLFAGLIFGVALIYLFKAYRRESELVLTAHQPPALPVDNETNNDINNIL